MLISRRTTAVNMLGNQFFAVSWSRRLTCLTSQGASRTVEFFLLVMPVKPTRIEQGDTDTTAPLARDSAWAEVSRRLKVLQKRLTAEEPSEEHQLAPSRHCTRQREQERRVGTMRIDLVNQWGDFPNKMHKQAVILEFLHVTESRLHVTELTLHELIPSLL